MAGAPVGRRRSARCSRCGGCGGCSGAEPGGPVRPALQRVRRGAAVDAPVALVAPAHRAGVRNDTHGDLRSVSQNRDFERAARRRVVEFDGGFLRQAAARVLGNDRPDQLQDFLARQRMARRVLRRPGRIHDSSRGCRRRDAGHGPTCRSAFSTCLQPHSRVHLGQRHDMRRIDQQRAVGELDVAKPLVDVRVVAQAIAAGGTEHDHVSRDRLRRS